MNTICISLIILYLVIEKIISMLKRTHFLNELQRARGYFLKCFFDKDFEHLEEIKKIYWEQLRDPKNKNIITFLLELEELCNKRQFAIRIENLENEVKELRTEVKK